jgi:hypothetical protein
VFLFPCGWTKSLSNIKVSIKIIRALGIHFQLRRRRKELLARTLSEKMIPWDL